MSATVVTTIAKRKMLRARAGLATLPAVKGMAFGDGGVDSGGNPVDPSTTTPALHNELMRKVIDGYEVISDTDIRYSCTLDSGELDGENISEIALYDMDDDIIAMKTFSPKGKDAGEAMVFECDDMF